MLANEIRLMNHKQSQEYWILDLEYTMMAHDPNSKIIRAGAGAKIIIPKLSKQFKPIKLCLYKATWY